MKMLKVYSPVISRRLEYVADVIFNTILGIEYELTSDRRKIGANPAILYTDEKVKAPFVIRPSGLLSESGINVADPGLGEDNGIPVIFPVTEGDLPFDIFAAVFWMVSRYEEYLKFPSDAHGRFPGSGSYAFRHGFLHLPVVDIWSRTLASHLVKHFPVLTIRHNVYSSLLTVDVDQPFAYKSRGLLRSVGGLVKGMAGTGAGPASRVKTMLGKESDPYDSFSYIDDQTRRHGSRVLYFFPFGDRGPYDHNPSWKDSSYQELIRRYDHPQGCGIHPSYRSAGRLNVLEKETVRYRHVTGRAAEAARQHWLLLRFPETYNNFEKAGIRYDYTMGYADEPGYRAGIARPFTFYDLTQERITGLKIVPYQFMDGTLAQYKSLRPERAIAMIKSLIEETRNVGGEFVSIWHNTSLSETNGWEGWREVFEKTLEMQRI